MDLFKKLNNIIIYGVWYEFANKYECHAIQYKICITENQLPALIELAICTVH